MSRTCPAMQEKKISHQRQTVARRTVDVPSRRVSPFTLLSHKDTIRIGLKDGGDRGQDFFSLHGVMCCRPRRPDMGSPGKGVVDGRAGGG